MKEKINKDNINDYYDIINKRVDEYITMGVSPSALKRYFKSGSKGLMNFLRKEEIDGVNRIDQVVHDVIDDRIAKEEASLMTFEAFKSNIFSIKYLINDDNLLKKLSDRYKITMGRIEQDHNYFTINDLGNKSELVILDEDKINSIKYDLAKKIYQDFISKEHTYNNLIQIDFSIKDKIEGNLFLGNLIDNELGDNMLNILEELISISVGERFEFEEKIDQFLIFKKS